MKVDVRLCGAIPRSEWTRTGSHTSSRARLTSSSYVATTNALANAPTAIRSKTTTTIGSEKAPQQQGDAVVLPPQPTPLMLLSLPSQNTNCNNNNNNDLSLLNNNNNLAMPLLEPPTWAVPASGEARLEPVCEALGKHAPIDLTTRSFFRVGRSPASDVQLLHGTSSRRHAMIFHHPNGSCYIVDCGSAHGTFVNGHRIITKTTGGWVVPHKVRRGSLVRFGGPGAPAFVLKSFAIGFSAMVSLDEEDGDEVAVMKHSSSSSGSNVQTLMASQSLTNHTIIPPKSRATLLKNPKWLLQVNTRLNAMGRSSNPLTETSANVISSTNKRSISFDSQDDNDCVPCKRARCMSPPLSPEAPIRLVSPESSTATLHSFSTSTTTTTFSSTTTTNTKRVTFSQDLQPFYPALVSPEELSDNEDHGSATALLAPMPTTTTALM